MKSHPLRNRIRFLEAREKTLRELIGSTLTTPDARDSAKDELSLVLSEAWMVVAEVEGLEQKNNPKKGRGSVRGVSRPPRM